MERLFEQSLASAIEACCNNDHYRVLIVANTWQRADYWSQYIVDKYGFVFQGVGAITRNKFRTANGSEIRLISQSYNTFGCTADLILYDDRIGYDAFVALELIESRLTCLKLNQIMED